MTDQKKWGHDELAHDLADHLTLPERIIWTDMQMGMSGSARPDVFTLQKSYVRPFPTTYEIKISISDFRSDITSGKWQKYLPFSTAVIFAVPQGLVSKDDIPNGCGLMVRGENGWRTIKKPTRQKINLPEQVMLKLLIDGIERARRPRPAEWHQYQTAKKIKKLFGEDVAKSASDLSLAREDLGNIQLRIDSEIKRAQLTANKIIEDAKELREKSVEVFGEVCRALGMETVTGEAWKIKRHVQDMLSAANESEVIQKSIRSLERTRGLIDRDISDLNSSLNLINRGKAA